MAMDVFQQIRVKRKTLNLIISAKVDFLLLEHFSLLGSFKRPPAQDLVVDQEPPIATNAPAAFDQTFGV